MKAAKKVNFAKESSKTLLDQDVSINDVKQADKLNLSRHSAKEIYIINTPLAQPLKKLKTAFF